MDDLPRNVDVDDISSTVSVHEQNYLNFNNTFNNTSNSFDRDAPISFGTMRIIFIATATITVLICLTICLTVCICICLKRQRKSKHSDNKDHLLPEQSNKSTKIPITNPTITNGKQILSNQQTNLNSTKTPINSFYYDNLDDIPFIDESRPTSVIDITHV